MQNPKTPYYFEIAREPASLSFQAFKQRYFDSETPVIIEKSAINWPASQSWNEAYIRTKLAKDPSAATTSLWYWLEKQSLKDDYDTPELITQLEKSADIFPRERRKMRIWIHQQGHVSSWHYDTNMVSVFNTQVTGTKDWLLVSPDTPLTCYPFTNFAIIDGKEGHHLAKCHHARFTLQAGDMLYVPPLWFHKVTAQGKENISLNWVLTKKKTQVASKTLQRELERYALHEYLTHHRFQWVREGFQRINRRAPSYIKWRWRYEHMLENPLAPRSWAVPRRFLAEIGAVGQVIRHAHKGKRYLDNLETVKKLVRS